MRCRSFGACVVALLCFAYVGAVAAQENGGLPARIVIKFHGGEATPGETAQEALARQRERPGDAAIAALSARAGTDLLWVKALGDGSHVFVPTALGIGLPLGTAIERLRNAPEVTWAEKDVVVSVSSVSDPYFPQQWALMPPADGSYGADFQTAWQTQQGIAGARIAIIDTGILAHPDITGPDGIASGSGALASEGYDFISDCRVRATCPPWTSAAAAFVDPQPHALDRGDWVSDADRAIEFFAKCPKRQSSWHGSHTSGTVAALANNGEGIVGGAFGATIVPVRVLGKCGGYTSDVAEAIRWAAGVHPTIANPTPARVLNLSLGAAGSCGTMLQAAIDAGSAAGVLIIVAAGNEATEASTSMLPSCSNVLAVAASTKQGDLAPYSNYSVTHVALSAPGGDTRMSSTAGIVSLANTGTTAHDPVGWAYAYAQGTSSSAPHVAAAAALMLSRNPLLVPAQLRSILTASSSLTGFPVGSYCATQGTCGAGLLNAQRAVSNSLSPLSTSTPTVDFGASSVGSEVQRELHIRNTSTALISVGSATLSEGAGFWFYLDECSGQTLSASETCRVTLSFAASSDGRVRSAMHVPTDAGIEGSFLAVELIALVGSRLISPTPEVSLDDVRVGETQRLIVAFESRYSEHEMLGAAYLVGQDAVISRDDCSGTELTATALCEIEVTMTPQTTGELTLQLVINTAGEEDIPYSVNFAGQAVTDDSSADAESDESSATSDTSGTETATPRAESGGGSALPLGWLLVLALLCVCRGRKFPATPHAARTVSRP